MYIGGRAGSITAGMSNVLGVPLLVTLRDTYDLDNESQT